MRVELMRRTARSLELVDLIAELEADDVLAFDLALSELRHELEKMKRALLDVPPPRVIDEAVRGPVELECTNCGASTHDSCVLTDTGCPLCEGRTP